MNPPRVKAKTVTVSAARVLGLVALLLAVAGIPNLSVLVNAPSRALVGGQVLAAPDLSGFHVRDQLLVKLASGDRTGTTASLAAAGMQVMDVIPQLGIAVVETAPGADLAAAAADLSASPAVEWAEPNYIFSLDFAPNDPYYASKPPYQTPYPLGLIQMPAAWDYTTGRPEVIVAILDTGIDLHHEDLAGGIWTNSGEVPGNEKDDDLNGFVDDVHGWNFADNNNLIADDHGHGTHVAGIAAARVNNGKGIAGMAGQATIMPVDVFKGGIGTYASLIRAIVYATDNGARVINMSLGATSYSRGEEAAVDYAWSHGVVVVAAAGNTGLNTYHYPAAHPHVIAVAATSSSDVRASFSTYGDFVDVAAPGVSVFSTYLGDSYGGMSGTSMASPHVAGLAALVLSLNPDLTPDEVRGLIEQNADDRGDPGWDPYYGYGRINAQETLEKVAPNPNPAPSPTPSPPLSFWPAGCQELISDGDFETGLQGWQASGSASITNKQAYSGKRSVEFTGGPGSYGVLTRTLDLPATPITATLWFAYRIATTDYDYGSLPSFPYDDWLTVEFRSQDGQVIQSLLRTGNSADTSNDGLPWDLYLYRMEPADFTALGAPGPVNLVFTAGNNADSSLTHFWVDAVRFCPRKNFQPIFIR